MRRKQETVGTLDLKIARLERLHKITQQQLFLSQTYPDHQMKLIKQHQALQLQLHRLQQRRRTCLGAAR